jgi:hypothetical protein
MTTSSALSNASSTVGRGPQEQALAVSVALKNNALKSIATNKNSCEEREEK